MSCMSAPQSADRCAEKETSAKKKTHSGGHQIHEKRRREGRDKQLTTERETPNNKKTPKSAAVLLIVVFRSRNAFSRHNLHRGRRRATKPITPLRELTRRSSKRRRGLNPQASGAARYSSYTVPSEANREPTERMPITTRWPSTGGRCASSTEKRQKPSY